MNRKKNLKKKTKNVRIHIKRIRKLKQNTYQDFIENETNEEKKQINKINEKY